MKKHFVRAIAILGLFAIILTGCKKYPEGPSLSLLSKKSRLAGAWKIESVTVNGTDQTSAYNLFVGSSFLNTIEKDGTYKITGNFTDTGTWKFSDNKEELISTSNTVGSTPNTVKILKLKSKELWTEDTDNSNNVTVVHYKQ